MSTLRINLKTFGYSCTIPILEMSLTRLLYIRRSEFRKTRRGGVSSWGKPPSGRVSPSEFVIFVGSQIPPPMPYEPGILVLTSHYNSIILTKSGLFLNKLNFPINQFPFINKYSSDLLLCVWHDGWVVILAVCWPDRPIIGGFSRYLRGFYAWNVWIF
jgi:hypothetical protein